MPTPTSGPTPHLTRVHYMTTHKAEPEFENDRSRSDVTVLMSAEVVPDLVELEVAVPRLTPTLG